jgi:hypothetical protein
LAEGDILGSCDRNIQSSADYSLLKSNDRFASLLCRPADGSAKRMPMATSDHGIKFHPGCQAFPCLNEISYAFETGFDFPARA